MGFNPTEGCISECGGHKNLATGKWIWIHNNQKWMQNQMYNKSDVFLEVSACVALQGFIAVLAVNTQHHHPERQLW